MAIIEIQWKQIGIEKTIWLVSLTLVQNDLFPK